MTNDEVKTLRVSTDAFAGADGTEAFREIFGRSILRIGMDPRRDHPLTVDLKLHAMQNFAMASGRLSPMRNRHIPQLIDNDDPVLVIVQSGVAELMRRRAVPSSRFSLSRAERTPPA